MLQRRFGVDPGAGYACVAWWTVPFLKVGAFRNILFPERGHNVPFTIENYPYVDGLGRPTVTFTRTLEVRPGRHLATDLELSVRGDGSLHLRSGALRFYEGRAGFTVPRFLTGTADLYEAYDDERQVYTIQLQVRNPVFGFLFGYRGEFTATFPSATAAEVPARLKPVREESRD